MIVAVVVLVFAAEAADAGAVIAAVVVAVGFVPVHVVVFVVAAVGDDL